MKGVTWFEKIRYQLMYGNEELVKFSSKPIFKISFKEMSARIGPRLLPCRAMISEEDRVGFCLTPDGWRFIPHLHFEGEDTIVSYKTLWIPNNIVPTVVSSTLQIPVPKPKPKRVEKEIKARL